jgi:hypothetical protein
MKWALKCFPLLKVVNIEGKILRASLRLPNELRISVLKHKSRDKNCIFVADVWYSTSPSFFYSFKFSLKKKERERVTELPCPLFSLPVPVVVFCSKT